MRYGACYKGSKCGIAKWVYEHLPVRDNFYDLFAGGCAITQRALMMQQFKRYFCNDLDGDGIKLFLGAINGDYANENRWISREDFFALKDTDPYIKYAWSFGNNGRDYLYSREIEPYKRAWHFAIFFHDYKPAEELGLDLKSIEPIANIYDRYIATKRITESCYHNANVTELQSFTREQQLEALNRLQSLQSLQSLRLDYAQVEILPNSLIYCDIPYKNTNAYGNKKINSFDYERFYSWCEQQTELVIISEYEMPRNRFICIDEIEKSVMMNSGADQKTIERLFVPKHQKHLIKKIYKQGELF